MILTVLIFIGIIVLSIFLLFTLRRNNLISLDDAKKLNETPNSYYFKYANQFFHYTEKGAGEVIILIHGIGDSFYVFNDLAENLAKNYKVICVDLPGFGLSEIPNSTEANENIIHYFRDFMDSFLTQKNIKEFHLAGNSLGGLVSWDWAVNNTKFNLKSLTLIASAGFDMNIVRKNVSKGVLDKLPSFLLKKGAPLRISKVSAETCIVDKSKIPANFVKAHHSMINKEGTIPFFIKLLFNSFEPEVNKLKTLEIPTLIVWGNKDKIIPVSHASKFQHAIKNSEIVTYKNVGHYPQIEESKKLAKDFVNFLKRI